jgi:transposase
MSMASPTRVPNAAEVAALGADDIETIWRGYAQTIDGLKAQVDWFNRQLFGRKSERFAAQPEPLQMHLGELMPAAPADAQEEQKVPAHTRRKPKSDFADDAAQPFFDETKVPVQTIEVAAPEIAGLTPDEYEVVGEKVSLRLAQRPGSYVVLKYKRSVVKLLETQTLHCAAAPAGVIDGSRADVSFLAGLMIDKFQWHLPLYRQHQRLLQAGFKLSRQWLTQLVQQGAQLLEAIYEAQLASIRAGRVIAMDETPIKAGRVGPGKMGACYFWPVYGEQDEVCFPFFESRRHEHVAEVLGVTNKPGAVLLSDGYDAYVRYAEKTKVKHAQCWAHSRRMFFKAQGAEPEHAAEALRQIGEIYKIEADIRKDRMTGETKRLHRLTHSKPGVEKFFEWVDEQFKRQGLLPSNLLTKAMAYVRGRRVSLEVFLGDADVPIDTNHLERALRPIPLGRKNWMFCWTEVGAKHAGILQSLIVTCRLHDIDPYTYLVDVLQRVGVHPDSRVVELTPRLWKQNFAQAPLRSDLQTIASAGRSSES